MDNHLYIKIARYALLKPEGFSPNELLRDIQLNEWENRVIQKNFQNACDARISADNTLNTIFLIIDYINNNPLINAVNTSKYILKYDAFYDYLDYLEFQEARKSSKQAMDTSKTAIKIAWITLVVSIIFSIVSIYFSQSTKLDRDQFIEIKNLISSEVRK